MKQLMMNKTGMIAGALLFGASLIGTMTCTAFADAESSNHTLKSEGDGFPIHVTYYHADEDKNSTGIMNAPVVIMLHGENGSRRQWDKASSPRGVTPFPEKLQELGYAVITVDLRKHGESVIEDTDEKVIPTDYTKMVLGDLGAVKRFMYEQHQRQQLNMNKTAIIAVGMSAPIAAGFAEQDWKMKPYDDAAIPSQRTPRGQDVQALIFISPEQSVGKVRATRSMNFLRSPNIGLDFMVIAGGQDSKAKKNAQSVYQVFSAIKQNEERGELKMLDTKANGMALMQMPPTVAAIPMIKFLKENLQSHESTWIDRRSRLDR